MNLFLSEICNRTHTYIEIKTYILVDREYDCLGDGKK